MYWLSESSPVTFAKCVQSQPIRSAKAFIPRTNSFTPPSIAKASVVTASLALWKNDAISRSRSVHVSPKAMFAVGTPVPATKASNISLV